MGIRKWQWRVYTQRGGLIRSAGARYALCISAVSLLGLAGATRAALAQEGGESAQQNQITLDSSEEGWVGVEPASIRDETNPTLTIQADQQYELVWVNRDGREHELVIVNEAGEDLVETQSAEQSGVEVRTTFRADERMEEYYCWYHRQTERGAIEITN